MEPLVLQERTDEKPNRLRAAGLVPVGYIERGQETRKMQATEASIKKVLAAAHGQGTLPVAFEGDKKKRNAVIKSLETSLLTKHISTLVLMEISMDEVLTVDVNVVAVGTPGQVAAGEATLGHPTSHVKVKGKASDLPSAIPIDVSAMVIGDHINAGDVTLPEGIELVSPAEATLFTVQIRRAVVVDEAPAEEGGQPEVIGEAASEGQAEEDTD